RCPSPARRAPVEIRTTGPRRGPRPSLPPSRRRLSRPQGRSSPSRRHRAASCERNCSGSTSALCAGREPRRAVVTLAGHDEVHVMVTEVGPPLQRVCLPPPVHHLLPCRDLLRLVGLTGERAKTSSLLQEGRLALQKV